MDLTRNGAYALPQEQIEYDRAHFADRLIYYIGAFLTEKEILRRFAWTDKEMNERCEEAFAGMGFHDVYAYVYSDVMREGKSLIEEFAAAGNASAIKIFAEAILKLNQEEAEDRQRLTINIDV